MKILLAKGTAHGNVEMSISESRQTLYVGMALTRPLSLKKYNCSELLNATPISLFRHITWPTSASRHDNTFKGGQIHRYNDICEIAKPRCLHHHLLLLLILQTVQHKIGTSIYLDICTKQLQIPVCSAFCQRNLCRAPPGQVKLRYTITFVQLNAIKFSRYCSCVFYMTTSSKRGRARTHTRAKSIVFVKYTTKNQ